MIYANPRDFGAIGDGITDDTAAFVAALAASDTVWMDAGTFAISGVSLASGQKFLGSGDKTKLVPSASFVAGANLVYIGAGSEGVEVGGLSADIPQTLTGSCAVYASFAARVHIHDILSYDSGFCAVRLDRCDKSLIERVRVLAAHTYGIQCINGNNNRITDCQTQGVGVSHHIQLQGENRSKIDNCFADSVTGSGFGMNLYLCQHCAIKDCSTVDCKYEGINITDSSFCLVADNNCDWTGNQSTDFGISLNGHAGYCNLNIIRGNTINRSGKSGIAIYGTLTNSLGNLVEGNMIYAAGQLGLPNDGAILIACQNGSTSSTTVIGNLCYGDGTKTRYGVLESTGYGPNVSNNRLGPNGVFNMTVSPNAKAAPSTALFVPPGW